MWEFRALVRKSHKVWRWWQLCQAKARENRKHPRKLDGVASPKQMGTLSISWSVKLNLPSWVWFIHCNLSTYKVETGGWWAESNYKETLPLLTEIISTSLKICSEASVEDWEWGGRWPGGVMADFIKKRMSGQHHRGLTCPWTQSCHWDPQRCSIEDLEWNKFIWWCTENAIRARHGGTCL